jgi:hypothetical protein
MVRPTYYLAIEIITYRQPRGAFRVEADRVQRAAGRQGEDRRRGGEEQRATDRQRLATVERDGTQDRQGFDQRRQIVRGVIADRGVGAAGAACSGDDVPQPDPCIQ